MDQKMSNTKPPTVASQRQLPQQRPRHSNNNLRDDHVGISICFRGQASEVVAENTTNQLESKIRKIGLKKGKFAIRKYVDWLEIKGSIKAT